VIDPPTSPPEPLTEPEAEAADASDDAARVTRARARRERTNERWRDRLVSEGSEALHEFADRHPMADLPRLRNLLRQARRHPGGGKSKQALDEILRTVREISEIEANVRRASTRP